MDERTIAQEAAINVVVTGAELLVKHDDIIETSHALRGALMGLGGDDRDEALRVAAEIIAAIRLYPSIMLILSGEGGPTELVENAYDFGYMRGRQAAAEAIMDVGGGTESEARDLAILALGQEQPSEHLCDVHGFKRP